jgi:TonB family protein
LDERIDLLVLEEKPRAGGISLAVVVSLVLHTVLLVLFIRSYRAAPQTKDVPIARYVELIQQNPQEFVEAPGPKVDTPSLNAPLSNANRKASIPEPTGDRPTKRPGDGRGLYTPPTGSPAQRPQPPQQQAVAPPMTQPSPSAAAAPQILDTDRLTYREPAKASLAPTRVDLKAVLREAAKAAPRGGGLGGGFDLGQAGGGEQGFAEQGPLSFETSWFDWGDYAQSMVSKIRVNWYANMPQIIRSGIKGQVTIRFTIQRDGRITDVAILKSSDVPPYDFAARKAIELSSPLAPLPRDFPNPSERVTAMFFYNMAVE